MNRMALIKELERYGWQNRLLFDGKGPLLQVTGIVNEKPFQCTQHVPVRLLDDHRAFLEKVYVRFSSEKF